MKYTEQDIKLSQDGDILNSSNQGITKGRAMKISTNSLVLPATIISMIGAVTVAFGYAFETNLMWSLSNPIMVIHNLYLHENAQARLFSFFTLCSWYGVLRGIFP